MHANALSMTAVTQTCEECQRVHSDLIVQKAIAAYKAREDYYVRQGLSANAMIRHSMTTGWAKIFTSADFERSIKQ